MGTIAITGSASGIGAATAAALRAQGDTVIGVDLCDAEVECDLSTPEGREAAVRGVLDACGGVLDGAVACAGISTGLKRPARDIVIPAHIPEANLARYLADLRHEYASPSNSTVRQLDPPA